MNNPDKQYTDLVNDAYKRYADSHTSPPSNPGGSLLSDNLYSVRPMTHSKESFIDKIKTDDEFAKTWGFQVYTRELSLEERNDIYKKQWESGASELSHDRFDSLNIPTRAISLTYNNQTIEIYEYIR